MRIVDIVERAVSISRYADSTLASGGLTTSIVAVVTDVVRAGRPVIGFGFSSMGRFAQSGLIRERFAPRLLAANTEQMIDRNGTNIDPFRAWAHMMKGEKPGGHGERCVAIGTLDMALWDAAAKIAGRPLYAHLAAASGSALRPSIHRSRPMPAAVIIIQMTTCLDCVTKFGAVATLAIAVPKSK